MASGITNPDNLQPLPLMAEATKSVTQGKLCMSRTSFSVLCMLIGGAHHLANFL